MEPIVTGAAANISSEAAKGTFLQAKRHVRYVIIYKKNVKKFEEKLKKLIEKRESVEQDVLGAERNGEKIKADVLGWRKRVDKFITEEKKQVKDLEVKANNKCFFAFCPNIKSRYRLSRKAEEGANAVDELFKECQFNGFGYRDAPEAIVRTDFESFQSRVKVFNDFMESLKDSTMRMVGVYGMAGVGKSWFLKEVERQVHEVKLFDSVVWVIVSPNPDIQKIQDQIAESLGSKLEEKTPIPRARRLCERLKKEEKVLIILDDIWKKLDLEDVGIPFGNQHTGCKILLASRNQNVLTNEMDATKTFPIGDLHEEAALEFFKKMAAVDGVEIDEELQSTVIDVAKNCAKLPLAIATVARALRNKPLPNWREALRQLQRPYSENPSEISAKVFKALELSFNLLPSEKHQQTFLLCSLLRRHTLIEYLLTYAIGLGLINGVATLEEARDSLQTMMSELKESCLLIDSNIHKGYFDVHDLTYLVAKSIASKNNLVFALKREDAKIDWPDGDSLKMCNQIFLEFLSNQNLPDQLNCPQLSLFLLYCDKDLSQTLSVDFFKEATNLKVLTLARMRFSSLPSSIRLLTSLTTLCLHECELGDNVSIIGGLGTLEILILARSDIRILPKEIGQLVKLKWLDVSGCFKLKTISAGVLSSFSRLEELYMGGTSIQWEVERADNEQSCASLAELNSTLPRLSALEVQILDAKDVPKDFFQVLRNLERYNIFIGKEWDWFGRNEYSRTIKLRLSAEGIANLVLGIRKLLKKTEYLYLDELKGVKNIALQELIDEETVLQLKNLHIQDGLDIGYIIDDIKEFPHLQSLTLQALPQLISFCHGEETGAISMLQHELPLFTEKILFPSLENLRLSSINVTRIWHNKLSNASFWSTHEKLTTLKIQDCGNLKRLLSFPMAKCLVHLTELEVIGCNSLREIIFTEAIEEEEEEIRTTTLSLFPQLKSLKLKDLGQLIVFWSNSQTDQVIEFGSMRLLIIENCLELESFIYT